jgi:internalin A
LGGTKVTAKGAETLARCKALHHLLLGRADFGAEQFGQIATLTRLRTLEVGKLPDDALKDLEQLSDLRDLRLGRVSTLAPVAKLTQLESFGLRTGIGYLTADGWKTIAGLENLKTLRLGDFEPNDWPAYRAWDKKRKAPPLPAAAAALGDLRGLKTLDLTGLSVGDDVLTAVARLGGLEELSLCCTLVTFEDVKGLDALAKLQALNARNCTVTDKGLRAIEALKGLRVLYLYDNAITEGGVRRLQNALPKCSIHRKYGKGQGDHHFRIPGGYGK